LITPIGQRQILQTVTAEAVRAAQEGSELVQREVARRQFLEHLLAEDQGAVHQVTSTENLRLEENAKEQRRRHKETPAGKPGEQAEQEEPGQAGPADPHLDFLA
jgi:deoxyribodipyrimidine photolyase